MTALLSWRAWAAIVIAVALAASHWKAYNLGGNSVRVQWDADKLAIARQSLKLSEQATRETVDLQTKSDTLRVQKNAQINKLNAAIAVALASLRDRPQRPADGSLPETAATGPACTGARLYADDAAAFVREAARADAQRLQLVECQAAYSNARDALNP
jgi:hypothetical protein